MSQGLHPLGENGENKENDKISREETMKILKVRQSEFEAQRRNSGDIKETSVDSIAKDAMLNGGKVSDEPWGGDEDVERDNFVQEELYVHSKILIADDTVAICGSANINDRVGHCHVPLLLSP